MLKLHRMSGRGARSNTRPHQSGLWWAWQRIAEPPLLCWDNRDATIASQIPNVVGRDSFQLILAGPMTTAQELLLAKRHECDSSRVREAHKLLRQINPLYAGIKDNKRFPTQRQDCHAFCTRLDDDDETGELSSGACSPINSRTNA